MDRFGQGPAIRYASLEGWLRSEKVFSTLQLLKGLAAQLFGPPQVTFWDHSRIRYTDLSETPISLAMSLLVIP